MRGLVAGFESAAQTPVFSHEMHLGVIGWILLEYAESEGVERIIGALRARDRRGARPLSPGFAYNETITLFWVSVARSRMPKTPSLSERFSAARSFARTFGTRERLVYTYFSRELVHSWKARTMWVEPDVRPLDGLYAGGA